VNLARILEQPQCDAVNRSVTPSLIEEPAGTVEVVEIVLVCLTPPEGHVCNFKVAPEVARRVTLRLVVVVWPPGVVRYPFHRIVVVKILGMVRKKLDGLRPQSRESLGVIVKVDCEAVSLVVVMHVTEHVVIDIAEEMNIGLDAPIVPGVCERRVLVEKSAVPPTHLVIRHHARILDAVALENLG
jgi:hypothetical protein